MRTDALARTGFPAHADRGQHEFELHRSCAQLNKTQAAVSMQIRRLEELTGVTLFDRGKRSLRLTGDGKIVVGSGKKMLALNEEAFARVRPDQIVGARRLGAVARYAIQILPPLLAEFAALYRDRRGTSQQPGG